MNKKTMQPLSGIRILDLSLVLAGPLCTQQMSDMGAEVIKIEHPVRGDDTREMKPPERGGESHFYLSANRNKRSVALDFDAPEGRKIIHGLAEHCDVLIENFRTGVMARRGLDYAGMKDRHPHLIYCSISAYGRVSPMAERPGFDPILQAEAGLMSFAASRMATRCAIRCQSSIPLPRSMRRRRSWGQSWCASVPAGDSSSIWPCTTAPLRF